MYVCMYKFFSYRMEKDWISIANFIHVLEERLRNHVWVGLRKKLKSCYQMYS